MLERRGRSGREETVRVRERKGETGMVRASERREAREPPSTATTGFSRRKKVLKEGAIQQTREMSCVL